MTKTTTQSPVSDNPELEQIDSQIAELNARRRQLLFGDFSELTFREDLNINPKQYWPSAKNIIKYAFSITGKDAQGKALEQHYFEWGDAFNISCQRALSAIMFYDELSKKMSFDFLKQAMVAADNCLKSMKDPESDQFVMRPTDAQNIIRIVLSRLNSPMLEPDIMYKLCSVAFIDTAENPDVYEYNYGKEKIALWKSLPNADVFFSGASIRRLIPYIDAAAGSLLEYNNLMEQRGRTELNYFQSFLTSDQKKRLSSTKAL